MIDLITDAIKLGFEEDKKGLELLKKSLDENGFKHTHLAANTMINEMKDLGMPLDVALYYQMLATRL